MLKKRLVVNLAVALLAFGVGVVSSGLQFNSEKAVEVKSFAEMKSVELVACLTPTDPQEVLNVDFWDLMAEPQRYDDRLVRFDAIMIADSAYEPLWDHVVLRKPGGERTLWVDSHFHYTSRTCPAVMQKLDALLMQEVPGRTNCAAVTVVGRFTGPKVFALRDGGYHYESERFTIVSVEKVSSVEEDN